MKELFCIHLLTIIYGRIFGLNLLRQHKEEWQEQLCDKNLIDSTLDLFPHSLYYVRLFHCDHQKELEKSKLFSQLNGPSSRSEMNMCAPNWTENVQEDRIPRVLMTAECESTCESVSYTLSVLKLNVCVRGYSAYRQEIQTISVACVPKHQQSVNPEERYTNLVVQSRIRNAPTTETFVNRNAVTFDEVKDPD